MVHFFMTEEPCPECGMSLASYNQKLSCNWCRYGQDKTIPDKTMTSMIIPESIINQFLQDAILVADPFKLHDTPRGQAARRILGLEELEIEEE